MIMPGLCPIDPNLGSAGPTASQGIDDCCQCFHFGWRISNLMDYYGTCILIIVEAHYDIPEDICFFLNTETYIYIHITHMG